MKLLSKVMIGLVCGMALMAEAEAATAVGKITKLHLNSSVGDYRACVCEWTQTQAKFQMVVGHVFLSLIRLQ